MTDDIDARCFIRRINALVPADIMAEEFLSTIKIGREVLITIRRARNPRHHRLLFAALRKVVENTDKWASEETLLDELKLATGLAEIRVNLLTGRPYAVPASISFAAMDQLKFSQWFERATPILAQSIGVENAALMDEVNAMMLQREAR